MIHELKTLQPYFEQVKEGKKTFEIRENDRDFRLGDWLLLQEYNAITSEYSGYEIMTEVTYLTNFEQKDNYVVMAIKII